MPYCVSYLYLFVKYDNINNNNNNIILSHLFSVCVCVYVAVWCHPFLFVGENKKIQKLKHYIR